MTRSRRTVVVGAGSAGCVVASRLSERPDHEVIIVEAGPDRTPATRPPALRAHDWYQALAEPGALWDGVTARRTPMASPHPYLRGRGVGGSASVNGMIAQPGLPRDYDRWAEAHGCVDWSWQDVQPEVARLRPLLSRVGPSEISPFDLAFLRASNELGYPEDVDPFDDGDGAGRVWVTADARGRLSSAELWLDPARRRAQLRVRCGATVDRVLLADQRASGVRLTSGETIEADHVVLCAGAIESPAILLRSGLTHPGLGRGLRDHPSAAVGLALDSSVDGPFTYPAAVSLRASSRVGAGDLQVLPLHLRGPFAPEGVDAQLIVSVMSVQATGQVSLDPRCPNGPPVVDLRLLDHPSDQQAAVDAAALVVALVGTPAMQQAITRVTLDGASSSVEKLADPAAAIGWMTGVPGGLVHACGTCRMGPPSDRGRVVDTSGRVVGVAGLYVMDASVFPDIPAAGTHLPTVIVAERLSRHLARALA